MIKIYDERLTPNQFAKLLVGSYGVETCHYYTEYFPDTYQAMTQREVDELDAALEKVTARIEKALGFGALMKKVYGREE